MSTSDNRINIYKAFFSLAAATAARFAITFNAVPATNATKLKNGTHSSGARKFCANMREQGDMVATNLYIGQYPFLTAVMTSSVVLAPRTMVMEMIATRTCVGTT